MDWSLTFKESQPVTIEMCEQALSGFVGGPVSTERPSFSGNPRDGFYRSVTITGPFPARDLTLVLSVSQEAWTFGDEPEATSSLGDLRLAGPTASFETKLHTWQDLRVAFAELGWTDRTLLSWTASIVDDAEAAGESDTAAFLRSEITAARVAYAKNPDQHFQVRLSSPRADDLEAILEAWVEPERIVHMHLDDCGLIALPKAFARFPNIELLSLSNNHIESSVLRVSLPKLYMLMLSRCAITTLSRDDLAGFPDLKYISLESNPLREIDPAVLDACPKLETIYITDTPLAKDDARLAALRARCPNVKI